MSLSKQHLSSHTQPVVFDPATLGCRMEEVCPEVVFALLLGSSRDGHVAVGSDIDVALYVQSRPTFDVLDRVTEKWRGRLCSVGRHARSPPVSWELAMWECSAMSRLAEDGQRYNHSGNLSSCRNGAGS